MFKMKALFPLLLPCLLLLAGCATLSERMEAYRKSYHGLKVNVYKMGSGLEGVLGVTSIKMNGYETVRTIRDIGYSAYNPEPKPFHPAWFTSSANIIFTFPNTIEVTWYIYEEQQFYTTLMTMPSYKEIQSLMGEAATSTIGLGIIFDMPPQVKCFLFDSSPYTDSRTYHLVATGMGRPIPGNAEKLEYLIKFYCEKGFLSDRVCAPYRTPADASGPKEATPQGHRSKPGKAAPGTATRATPQKPRSPKTVDPGTNPVMVRPTYPAYPANAPR